MARCAQHSGAGADHLAQEEEEGARLVLGGEPEAHHSAGPAHHRESSAQSSVLNLDLPRRNVGRDRSR